MLKFGQTIKSKREEKGWTQKELAEKLFVTDKAVSRWENDKSYPDITLLLEIAAVLEFDYQELLEGQKYVQRVEFRKKMTRNIVVISIILFLVTVCMFGFSTKKRNEELGKGLVGADYIISETWSYFSTMDEYVQIYSDFQREQIISFLDVDNWEKIDCLPPNAIEKEYLKMGNRIKFEEYRIYENNGEWYIVFETEFYMGNSFMYGVLTKYGDVYKVNKDLSNINEFLLKLPNANFNYQHAYNNHTNFRKLDELEILSMDTVYYKHEASRDILAGCLLVHKEGPHYFYFTSDKVDVRDVYFEDGIVYLEGEYRSYSQPYVCIMEIEYPDSIKEVRFNGEQIYTYGVDFRNDPLINE